MAKTNTLSWSAGFTLIVTTACGASGRDWVAETPEPEVSVAADTRAGLPPGYLATEEQRSLRSENGVPPREARPNRVVTLGETEWLTGSVGAERGVAEAPSTEDPEASSPIQIVYIGGVYGPWGSPWWREVRQDFPDDVRIAPQPSSPRIGQDWPSAPNYGPAFPYRTAPASPWGSAR